MVPEPGSYEPGFTRDPDPARTAHHEPVREPVNEKIGASAGAEKGKRRGARRCGTYAGYQRHRVRGEEACDPCKKAAADYMREHRSDPEAYALHKLLVKARNHALTKLGNNHPEEYEQLFLQEKLMLLSERERERGKSEH